MMYPTNKQGKRYPSDRGKAFKKESQELLTKVYKASKMEGEIKAHIKLFRPRASGDIDNYIKPILDAMQGICFEDDKQIAELFIKRYEDKNNPRVEISLYELGNI